MNALLHLLKRSLAPYGVLYREPDYLPAEPAYETGARPAVLTPDILRRAGLL